MIKEWIIVAIITLATLAGALQILRTYAPGLLGIPVDLQMVKAAKSVPPFYENIFRADDMQSKEFLLQDPYTKTRAHPLFPASTKIGPHDLLGFRNHAVPNVVDIITIGDSQTYGNNVLQMSSWPSIVGRTLANRGNTVYNVSTGGWGAVQYLYMAANVTVLRPRVLAVAYYTGNDPLESFAMAYNYDEWEHLRPNPSLTAGDLPEINYPAPLSEQWHIRIS